MYERRIGLRVNRLREQQGLTTTELAKRVGISQAQISRLENGKQGFRSSTLEKIARALGVKPAYFWMEEPQGTVAETGAIYGAPGKLGEALKNPEFQELMEKAAIIYLEKREAFGAVQRAIKTSGDGVSSTA